MSILTYDEMYQKFYGKSVTFQTSNGEYIPGVVESIDTIYHDVMIIIDSDGEEHIVDYANQDVVLS